MAYQDDTRKHPDLSVLAVADDEAMRSTIDAALHNAIGVRPAAAVHSARVADAIDEHRPDGVVAIADPHHLATIVKLIRACFFDAGSVITMEEERHAVVVAFRLPATSDGIAGCMQRLTPYLKTIAAAHINGNVAIVVDERDHELLALLTVREREILTLTAGGMTAKQTARQLNRSVSTVSRHVANIMRKLQRHDRVALSLFAVRTGLIKP
jgi:DNA-binding NarL/FixJ family response regulator